MTQAEVRTARASDQPCQLYSYHWPKPLRTQFHHSRPIYLQNRLYGKIRYPADFWVCGTCHDSLHEVIDWLLGEGRQPGGNVGRKVLDKARDTVDWYRAEQRQGRG